MNTLLLAVGILSLEEQQLVGVTVILEREVQPEHHKRGGKRRPVHQAMSFQL